MAARELNRSNPIIVLNPRWTFFCILLCTLLAFFFFLFFFWGGGLPCFGGV